MQNKYLCGINMVRAFLQNYSELVDRFYYAGKLSRRLDEILPDSKNRRFSCEQVSLDSLESMVGSLVHQGVVISIRHFPTMSLDDLVVKLRKKEVHLRILILDQVQDPQNLGACFRSAAAFGVHAIIVPDRNAVGITPVVAKVSSGACALVPLIKVKNLVRAIGLLKKNGLWVYATSEYAPDTLDKADMDRSVAWVMGGEEKGVRPLVLSQCDAQFKIAVNKKFTTLNVATATGIVLHQTFIA
ncbi:MAG: 23S rRNA (guanosine(2251)-2'-O)-methyltransferase RlmB [Pseudomonadota bacterium]|nr:23S rRNA (guanosine(2251)-2'-O)-methyltransferase RlmB [Pseudomonadota bacterium]